MIVCEHLSKQFEKDIGIKDVNLSFSQGLIYGIIGYNGAGKTTLLRCIEGLYLPSSGSVWHDKIGTRQEKQFVNIRRSISFLPTDDYLYNKLSCLENIELATILKTGKKNLLKETKLLIEYFEADKYLSKRFMDCSSGMKKKIQIIISLIGDINTIIWDEPNDGLDVITNIRLKELLSYYKRKNVTILLSSHVIEFLEGFIDYCILLKDGEIITAKEKKDINSIKELYIEHLEKDVIALPFK